MSSDATPPPGAVPGASASTPAHPLQPSRTSDAPVHRDPSSLSVDHLVAAAAAPAEERRVMLCLDEHDVRADAAVSYASYLVMPSLADESHRSCSTRHVVRIFAHVHLDSRLPFSRAAPRAERAERVRGHCHTVAAALAGHVSRVARDVEVGVDVDDSDMTQAAAYPHFAAALRPHYILLSERDDKDSPLAALFGSESWRVHHSLDRCTVIVAKSNIEGVDMWRGRDDDVGEAPRAPPSRALVPERGRGMYALLMVDPSLHEASQRAVACACDLLKPEDRLLVYCAWALPDFATAMYADDSRWEQVKAKEREAARRQAHAVAGHVSGAVGMPADRIRVVTEQQEPSEGAARLLRRGGRGFHLVICGGKRVQDPSGRGLIFRGWFSHYRRKALGTTADNIISKTAAPAVAVCY